MNLNKIENIQFTYDFTGSSFSAVFYLFRLYISVLEK